MLVVGVKQRVTQVFPSAVFELSVVHREYVVVAVGGLAYFVGFAGPVSFEGFVERKSSFGSTSCLLIDYGQEVVGDLQRSSD